ncbi:MAG: hypothetical protein IJU56_05965, partial [Clostridia bacterium]|nr:hypothetical protein [Clostridia bacterium]
SFNYAILCFGKVFAHTIILPQMKAPANPFRECRCLYFCEPLFCNAPFAAQILRGTAAGRDEPRCARFKGAQKGASIAVQKSPAPLLRGTAAQSRPAAETKRAPKRRKPSGLRRDALNSGSLEVRRFKTRFRTAL